MDGGTEGEREREGGEEEERKNSRKGEWKEKQNCIYILFFFLGVNGN